MEQIPTFDAAWKRRAIAGDAEAIGELVDASLEPLFRYCLYRTGRNRHLCEEVVQETVVRAIAELTNYQPERSANSLFPWLMGLARNEIRRALAHESSALRLEMLWERMDHELRGILSRLESEPLTSADLARAETREIVNVTMSQLPAHYRQALEAKYVSQRTVKAIASDQAMSEKAIESLLTRARQAFRETFLVLTRNLDHAAEGAPP